MTARPGETPDTSNVLPLTCSILTLDESDLQDSMANGMLSVRFSPTVMDICSCIGSFPFSFCEPSAWVIAFTISA